MKSLRPPTLVLNARTERLGTSRSTVLLSLIAAAIATMLLAAPAHATVWTPQYPALEVETTDSPLYDVSCTTTEACTAVGPYIATSEPKTLRPVAQRWNGTKWTAQSIPQPEKSAWADPQGVSCPSSSTCVMVGGYIEEETELRLPLAALWNGSKWTLQSIPVPEGAVWAFMSDVSCASATECVAVGYYSKIGVSKGMQLYLAKWNGTKWTRQIMPLPAGGSGGHLLGISCTSSSNCRAVGDYYSTEIVIEGEEEVEIEVPQGSIVDTWNGTKWTATDIGGEQLVGVSCSSSTSCMSNSLRGVIWRLSGLEWTKAKVSGPTGNSTWFEDVSCVSASYCVAVGEYEESFKNYLYVSEWNGTEWKQQTSIEPFEVGVSSGLSGVSCLAATACIAVGSSEYQAIAEQRK